MNERLRVQQASATSLWVNVFDRAGTVTGRHVGSGPHDWAWELECDLCGETRTVRRVAMNRLAAEVAMLKHAQAHRDHDPDGGPDAGFTGYGWGEPEPHRLDPIADRCTCGAEIVRYEDDDTYRCEVSELVLGGERCLRGQL